MATYYTSSLATGGGDGSINDEWTLAEALGASGMVQGDVTLVKADGTYNLTAKITCAIAAYDFEDPPILRGAASDGTDDGTVATINGSGITTDDMFLYDQGGTRIQHENLRWTAATVSAVRISNNIGGSSGVTFKKCRIDNCTSDGLVDEESVNHPLVLIDMEIDNNGGNGLSTIAAINAEKCSIHDNTLDGISLSGSFNPSVNIKGTLIYSNGANGIDINLGSGYIITGNVLYNNGGDGIELGTGLGFMTILNNIFRSNGAYGIAGASLDSQFISCDYNCYSNNTSGDVSWNSGTAPGDNNITSDPLFTSETLGSEDFTLQSSSPCIDVGFGYNG